jgi:hypothetical protein
LCHLLLNFKINLGRPITWGVTRLLLERLRQS